MSNNTFIVAEGQSIFDIAIQVYGDITGVFPLLADNGLTINDTLYAGNIITQAQPTVNQAHAEYIALNNIVPSSYDANSLVPLSGIGFWSIESNFIVQ